MDRRRLLVGAGLGMGMAALDGRRAQAGKQPGFPAGRIPVAFIVDEGANIIDLAGPWETFQDTRVNDARAFHLYAVGPERKTYQTTGNGPGGLPFNPHFTFEDAPTPKIVVMGAQGGADNPEKIAWIQAVASQADAVLSVCTGAFLLARTGLLDGLSATTHHQYYEPFAASFPQITLIRGRRFVDSGKCVTAGGLTSSIDGALHIVSRVCGLDAAARTAAYMEHDGGEWRTGVRASGRW